MPSGSRPDRPRHWMLHDAKARFSELFRKVREEGPQFVVKQGGESVVLLPAEEFDRLIRRRDQPGSLAEFFRTAPTGPRPLDLKRKTDRTRDVDW